MPNALRCRRKVLDPSKRRTVALPRQESRPCCCVGFRTNFTYTLNIARIINSSSSLSYGVVSAKDKTYVQPWKSLCNGWACRVYSIRRKHAQVQVVKIGGRTIWRLAMGVMHHVILNDRFGQKVLHRTTWVPGPKTRLKRRLNPERAGMKSWGKITTWMCRVSRLGGFVMACMAWHKERSQASPSPLHQVLDQDGP